MISYANVMNNQSVPVNCTKAKCKDGFQRCFISNKRWTNEKRLQTHFYVKIIRVYYIYVYRQAAGWVYFSQARPLCDWDPETTVHSSL